MEFPDSTLLAIDGDILLFARQILKEVDNARAYILEVDDENRITSQKPSESRVNAFFRLVGLPMFVTVEPRSQSDKTARNESGEVVLTPGYHEGGQIPTTRFVLRNSEDTMLPLPGAPPGVQLEGSASILLSTRENELLERENKIGTEFFNQAMIRSMYDLMPPSFTASRSYEIGGQRYDYTKRFAPFAVSYMRIFPHSRELARPFVPDVKDIEVNGQVLKRPFLETVIRIRLGSARGTNQKQTDYMSGLRDVLGRLSKKASKSETGSVQALAQTLLPSEANLLEIFVIGKMLVSVESFAQQWVKIHRRRERIVKSAEIALVPSTESAKQSPLGRQSNTALTLDVTPQSELGRKRVKLQQRVAAAEAIIGLLPTEDATNATTSARYSAPRNVMSNAMTRPFLSILQRDLDAERKQLEKVERQIQDEARRADRLRLDIENMTGEFTGLSMVDAAFTILALFLVERRYAVGLLDRKSRTFMERDSTLREAASEAEMASGQATAAESVRELSAKIEELYQLFERAVNYTFDREKRPNTGPSRRSSETVKRTASISRQGETLSTGGNG